MNEALSAARRGEGPRLGGRELGKSNDFSQFRLCVPMADRQSVHWHCSPDPATSIEFAELYRSGQERSESRNAVNQERYKTAAKVQHRARANQTMHD